MLRLLLCNNVGQSIELRKAVEKMTKTDMNREAFKKQLHFVAAVAVVVLDVELTARSHKMTLGNK